MGINKLYSQYKGLPKEIYIIFLNRFINSLGAFVFIVLALFLKEKLNMSPSEVGQYMMLLALVRVPGTMLSGKLVDMFNRKTILLISNLIGGTLLVMCGFLGTSHLVPILLVIQVFASSFASPASTAIMTDLTTPEERKKSHSLMYLANNLGFVFGFSLAGFLFENYTKWLFLGDGITLLFSGIMIWILVRDTKPSAEDIKVIEEDNSRAKERKETGSILSVLLKKKYMLAFAIGGAFLNFASSQHSFLLPLNLTNVFGVSDGSKIFGIIMSVNTITIVLLTPVIAKLTEKRKPISNVTLGAWGYAIGFGSLFFARELTMFFICATIFTIGEILIATNAGVYISNNAPITHRGRFNSILGLVWSTGGMLSPFIMGIFLTYFNHSYGWLLVGGVAFIGSLLIVGLDNKDKRNISMPWMKA